MKQTETHDTDTGMMVAIKDGRNEPWHIAYPEGDDRFYGSISEVRARMRAIAKNVEAGTAAIKG